MQIFSNSHKLRKIHQRAQKVAGKGNSYSFLYTARDPLSISAIRSTEDQYKISSTKTAKRWERAYSLLCAILNICVYACFRVEQRWTQQYLMYFIFRSISQWRFNKWSTAQCAVFDICICDTYDYNTSGNLLFCKRKIFYGFSKYRFALNSIFYCHHGKLNWVAAKKVLHILYQKHI